MTIWPTLLIAGALFSLPPLTPQQKAQLESAHDGSVTVDDPALYPLMINALDWDPTEAPAGQPPDVDALLASPAEYRGVPFLIEGQMRGPPRKFERFARPGPWAGKLEQWVVTLRRGAKAADDKVAIVYLVDPPEYPGLDRRVRLTARFFKVWHSVDMQNNETPYVTFVGRGVHVLDPSEPSSPAATATGDGDGGSGGKPDGGGTSPLVPISVFLLIGFLSFVWWRVRRIMGGPRPLPGQLRRMREHVEEAEEQEASADEGPPLPEDPIAALEEMQRRQHAKAEAEFEASPELRELRDMTEKVGDDAS
jgi:hypothetical protein